MDGETTAPVIDVSRLGVHLKGLFDTAVRHRQTTGVTDALLDCQRRFDGEYDSTKAAQISQLGGSDLYFNITLTKILAAEAWIKDVILPQDEDSWDLEPTPIPELSGDIESFIIEEVAYEASNMAVTPQDIRELALRMYDEQLTRIRAEAAKRVENMKRLMTDQIVEGAFDDARSDFIQNYCVYKISYLKGPILRRKPVMKWVNGAITVSDEIVPTWSAPSPHDIYHAPNATKVNDDYLCEVSWIPKHELSAQKGVEGWSADAIDRVLKTDPKASSSSTLYGSQERADMDKRDTSVNAGGPPNCYMMVEFWGYIERSMLEEWGMALTSDKDYVAVCAYFIGSEVVYAIANPDPLGEAPYSTACYAPISGRLYGRSISELMKDCQDPCCASLRSLVNNLAISSGPLAGVDIDAMPPGHIPSNGQLQIRPWQVFPYHGAKINVNHEPIRFFQPQSNAQVLIEVADWFGRQADDRTLIPRYQYGNDDVAGAGRTASGMKMLMESAGKGVKLSVARIDKAQSESLQRLFRWNMQYSRDESVKGDAKVVARGALAQLVKDLTDMRAQEFLASTNNPTDLQIMGLDRRRNLLARVAKRLDMPEEDIVPSKEEMQAKMVMSPVEPEPELVEQAA